MMSILGTGSTACWAKRALFQHIVRAHGVDEYEGACGKDIWSWCVFRSGGLADLCAAFAEAVEAVRRE